MRLDWEHARRALGSQRALLLFTALNLLMLLPDVALAHSTFMYSRAELIPLWLSAIGGVLALALSLAPLDHWATRSTLGVLSAACMLTGAGGVGFHLGADALVHPTLHRLVYSAPLLAPLSYAGLGLLLGSAAFLRSNMARGRAAQVLAGLGLLGNFVLCLLDHAQNNFWAPAEWLSVVAGAVGGLTVLTAAVLRDPGPGELRYLWSVLLGLIGIALIGEALHGTAALRATGAPLLDRLRYGAPIFAPMLFADLAALAAIGTLARGEAG